MRQSSQARSSRPNNNSGRGSFVPREASERDPLIPGASTRAHGLVRERRTSKSKSPQQQHNQYSLPQMVKGKLSSSGSGRNIDDIPPLPRQGDDAPAPQTAYTYDSTDSYEVYSTENLSRTRSARSRSSQTSAGLASNTHPYSDYRQQYYDARENRMQERGGEPPLLDVPEEILVVRRAALTVMEPLTYAWLVVAFGFAISVALGMSRWTNLISDISYWFILIPAWLSHFSLLVCHIMSAHALSKFISNANENRLRQESTDHLDRAEYLPLLQRSLKFGLKTGILSFCIFIFEILMFIRVSKGSISLAVAFIPMWIIIVGGITDGIICKTQHMLRVLCWVLVFTAMLMTVLRVDHGIDAIRWRFIVIPIVALLSISSGTLIYIVYGHQVGYYRLTEAQLTAGILYSMAALICIVLVVVIGELMPLARPSEVETRIFVVAMAPLVVALVGLGAWAVTRDEYERLLQYGGQAAVLPKKLRLEPSGWTSVESRGVTNIPMFGEVSYEPLDSAKSESIELCTCCACYPYADDDDMAIQYQEPTRDSDRTPQLSQSSTQVSSGKAATGGSLNQEIV